MDKTITNILERLENNGYEAYIVGGYVRDYLLGITSTDIDICTNALPKDIKKIFNIRKVTNNTYGSFKIITDKYNFDITTYRSEKEYADRKPVVVEYINNLIDDLKRRDFTINTICMNKEMDIIDLLDAKEDLDRKLIKIVGDLDEKLIEDPLRIIRALRLAITLDFNIDDNFLTKVIKHKELITTLSITRIKNELDKILLSKNAVKGLSLLSDIGILDILNISYDNIMYVSDLCGMYSFLSLPSNYPLTKSEKENITSIKKIIEYGKIDFTILFNYGLYLSLVAGQILNISNKDINEMYNNLPIKNVNEIDINGKEICSVLSIKPNKVLKDIFASLINEILNNRLINRKNDIIEYIIANEKKWLNAKNNK